MVRLTNELVQKLPTKGYINFHRVMSALTLDIFGQAFISMPFTFLDKLIDEMEHSKTGTADVVKCDEMYIYEDVETLTKGISLRMSCPKVLWSFMLRDHDQVRHATQRCKTYLTKVVRSKIQERERMIKDGQECIKSKDEMDVVDFLLQNGNTMTLEQVVEETLLFL